MAGTIVLSINTSWNIVNFRMGLIRRLQADGYHVVAVSPFDAHVSQLIAHGVEHVPIAIDSKGVSPITDTRLLTDYVRILRRLKPVAFLGWTVKPNVFGSLAAHALGIPVINNVSGLGTAFIRKGLLTAIVSRLYRVAFRRSSTVFFQNPMDRVMFVDQGIVAASGTVILPGSGIDLHRFAPDATSRPAGPFTFLMVARLLRDKGVGEYVEAARAVRARYPDVRCQLLGFLDVANRSAVSRADVDAWVAAGWVEYLGPVDDVRPAMTAADCVVLPSYREGMPRTLLEGAALGKPLIATDVPGCTEIARHGRNALLCTVRDAGSLADAMIEMLALSDHERAVMGAEGRLIAEREFSEDVVTDLYMAALSRAIGQGGPRRLVPASGGSDCR